MNYVIMLLFLLLTTQSYNSRFLADYQASKTVQVFVDVLTILFCLMSVSLCSRSIYRQLQLVKVDFIHPIIYNNYLNTPSRFPARHGSLMVNALHSRLSTLGVSCWPG